MFIIDMKTSIAKETTLQVDGSELGFGKNFNIIHVAVIEEQHSTIVAMVLRGVFLD